EADTRARDRSPVSARAQNASAARRAFRVTQCRWTSETAEFWTCRIFGRGPCMPASEAMPADWPNLPPAPAGSRVAVGDERSELALDAADSRDIRSDSRFRFPRFSKSANTQRGRRR